jgi:PAS domain S-box-containing protein
MIPSSLLSSKQSFIQRLSLTLIIFASLFPIISRFIIHSWIDETFDWNEMKQALLMMFITLILIAYPTFYLLRWESSQIKRWNSSKQDFILFMEQSIDMVILTNKDGNIKNVNLTSSHTLGYKKKDLLKMSISELDIQLKRTLPYYKIQKNDRINPYKTLFRKKNKSTFPVHIRVKQAGWLKNEHYIYFISDISSSQENNKKWVNFNKVLEKKSDFLEARIEEHSSEIKKQRDGREWAEQQFDAIQVYLSKLIDSMPSVIIALDLNQKILQWNKEAEKITGKASIDVIGSSLEKAYPELNREIKKIKHYHDLLQQSIHFRFKQKMALSTKTLDVMIYPIFNEQQIEQSKVIRIDDVTEKLRIDETLVQTEKMLSLGGLAAGMAHEINNPLGAIMQSTQNIKRRLSHDLIRNKSIAEASNISLDKVLNYIEAQKINHFLDGILVSGKRAAEIVGDMLSFARPAAQKSSEIDIIEAIDAAIRLSAKDYNQKKQFDFRNIHLRKNYAPHLGKVMAQKNQMEQVFLNLFINAAQALADNIIKTEPPLIEIIVRKEGKILVIEIIDNGMGMSEAVRKRVFEPFFTTKDEKRGTGLGLSVSYFIITEQLGGQLSVESQLKKGSRFTIRLPIKSYHKRSAHTKNTQIELPLL